MSILSSGWYSSDMRPLIRRIFDATPNLWRAYGVLRSLLFEITVRSNLRAAARLGFQYRAVDPGLYLWKVVYSSAKRGHKQYEVKFPNGKTMLIEASYERGFADIDGQAHAECYKRALELSPAFGCAIDCACGTGYGTNLLAERFESVAGVDIDLASISYGKERYRAPNITFHNCDIGGVGAAISHVDLIVSVETLEHVPDDEAMIRTFYSLLRPGGLLYITVPHSPDLVLTSPYHVREYRPGDLRGKLSDVFGSAEVQVHVSGRYLSATCYKPSASGDIEQSHIDSIRA
jgi:Methyltransferase domain